MLVASKGSLAAVKGSHVSLCSLQLRKSALCLWRGTETLASLLISTPERWVWDSSLGLTLTCSTRLTTDRSLPADDVHGAYSLLHVSTIIS